MISYYLAVTKQDYTEAGELFKEYAASIKISLDFQHFDDELDGLKTMYAEPHGGIILVKEQEEMIGCVAVRKIDNNTGELKRMYIKPGHQNRGIGKILLEKALQLARECNYSLVKLDTLNSMLPAIQLYTKAGFYETAPYYHNPHTAVIYFEKLL